MDEQIPPQSNSSRSKLYLITSFIFCVLISLLVGFYLGSNSQSWSTKPKPTLSTKTLMPTPVQNNKTTNYWQFFDQNKNGIYDTSSWKKYQSKDNQFSISYPDDWNYQEDTKNKYNCGPIYHDDNQCLVVTFTNKFLPAFNKDTESKWFSVVRPPFNFSIAFNRELNKNNITDLEKLFDDAIVKTKSIRETYLSSGKTVDHEVITVGNQKVLRYTYFGVEQTLIYVFLKDNYIYTVSDSGSTDNSWYGFALQTILAQMLNTFK